MKNEKCRMKMEEGAAGWFEWAMDGWRVLRRVELAFALGVGEWSNGSCAFPLRVGTAHYSERMVFWQRCGGAGV
jgi:hypothetical protein